MQTAPGNKKRAEIDEQFQTISIPSKDINATPTWSADTVYAFFFARSLACAMLITKLMMEMRMASVTKSPKISNDGRVGWKLYNKKGERKG